MPIHEYRCGSCSHDTVVLHALATDVGRPVACERCGSVELRRLVSLPSRVARKAPNDDREGQGPAALRSLGHWMRVAAERHPNGDLGDDWDETVRQMASGQIDGRLEVAPARGFDEPGPDAMLGARERRARSPC
jgi:putative FmdB family regulatory protein